MNTERRFTLAKIAFAIHSEGSTIEDTPLIVSDARQLDELYPCLRKKRLQRVILATGATMVLDHEEYCVNCGAAEPHFHLIGSELYCDGCHTLAKATHIVGTGLDAIIDSLVAEIPESEWQQLAWRITVGFGGDPCPNGINWNCEVIE